MKDLVFLSFGFFGILACHFLYDVFKRWLRRKDPLQDAFERAQKKKEDIADF